MQTLGLEIGVLDPTPPVGWPEAQRLGWFVGFAGVASFPKYLFAMSAMLPVLGVLVWPLRRLPTALALLLAALARGGLSLVALSLVEVDKSDALGELSSLGDAVHAKSLEGLVMTLAGPLFGGGLGALRLPPGPT